MGRSSSFLQLEIFALLSVYYILVFLMWIRWAKSKQNIIIKKKKLVTHIFCLHTEIEPSLENFQTQILPYETFEISSTIRRYRWKRRFAYTKHTMADLERKKI